MHTEAPEKTFRHLSKITSQNGGNLPVMSTEKALPRELLDDHFRLATHDFTKDQLWEMSSQLTELGKRLSDLKINIEIPDIPLLGIREALTIFRGLFIGTLLNVFGERTGVKKCQMLLILIGMPHRTPKDLL